MQRFATRASVGWVFVTAFVCCVAEAAQAGVPVPFYSTLPPCILAVPANPPTAVIIVKDIAFLPVVGATVVIEFSNCPDLRLCPDIPPPGFPHFTPPPPPPVTATTDANGIAHVALRGGGDCATGATVIADGVVLGTVRILSPDQDGDGDVDATDQALLNTRLAAHDARADLNCDFDLTGADAAVLTSFLGATCAGATPTRSTTWSHVKQFYR